MLTPDCLAFEPLGNSSSLQKQPVADKTTTRITSFTFTLQLLAFSCCMGLLSQVFTDQDKIRHERCAAVSFVLTFHDGNPLTGLPPIVYPRASVVDSLHPQVISYNSSHLLWDVRRILCSIFCLRTMAGRSNSATAFLRPHSSVAASFSPDSTEVSLACRSLAQSVTHQLVA